MKFSILCCLAAYITSILAQEDSVCNIKLMSSYGLKGLAIPRDGSIVCPQVTSNCCDKVDELYIHKYYQKNVAGIMLARYGRNNELIPQVAMMLQDLSKINFTELAFAFNNTPYCESIGGNITIAYNRLQGANMTSIVELFPNMTTNLTSIFKFVGRVREGFYCSLCDVSTQSGVDLEGKTIVYSKPFCDRLVALTFPSLFFKWTSTYGYLMHFDLILNQTQNVSLFTPEQKVIVTKILTALTDCQGSLKKPDCSNFCGLFYLNENSLLFDGDPALLQSVLTNYQTYSTPYKTSPPNMQPFRPVIRQKMTEALMAQLRARGLDRLIRRDQIDRLANMLTNIAPPRMSANGTN